MTSNEHNLQDKIAYFVHLHLDTARESCDQSGKLQIRLFTVEGKARPMLVIGQSRNKATGVMWYRVLKVTTKGLMPNGQVKEGVERIGDCIEKGRESFVELMSLVAYPENLLTRDIGGDVVAESVDPLIIQNVLRIVRHKVLGGARVDR
jgi:hypothetical protein